VSPPPPLPLTEAEADALPEAAAEEEAAGRPDESESTGLEAEADDDGPSGPRVVDNDGLAGVGAASSETEEDGSGPAAEDAVLETTSPAEVEVASVEEEVMAGSPLSAALLLLLLLPSLLLGLALADGSITAGQLEEAVAAAAADDDDGGSWSAPSAAGGVEVGGEGQGPATGEDEVSVWSPKDRAPPAAEKEVTAAVAVGAADGKKEAEGGLIDGGCGCWTSAGEAAVVVG